ncbi:MAG: NYN domain-containing protein [Candidatus Nealsonbacteria bacterium]|nr:MAG: NYN domain-containing protein [Candidatus Nealsonbacteria bacterium]
MDIFKNKKEKVAVYIDGSNFYGYLKDKEIAFPRGTKFDFKKFVNFLVGDKRKLVSKRYYTGVFRNLDGTDKSKNLVRGQQKFFSNLKNDGFIIKRGRIMPIDKTYKEKGTDVKIAVDLIVGAVDDLYDTAILVSSDTDLIPAIRYVKYKGKKIEYVGFAHSPSLGIQKYANLSRLLLPEDIEKFKEKTLL